MTALKSLFFLIFVPGLFIGYIPCAFLLTGPRIETRVFAFLAYPLWLLGAVMILWCFWDFLVKGRGTPAPVDPPKELVVAGFYRYVRNPMYAAVLLMLLGHFLWFGYWSLLAYTAFFFLAFHLFVLFYEEPNLRKQFGAAYEAYFRFIPRWIPRLPQG
jgi:protein-S-isoprenylcysteine O-methyltransferase Ste14